MAYTLNYKKDCKLCLDGSNILDVNENSISEIDQNADWKGNVFPLQHFRVRVTCTLPEPLGQYLLIWICKTKVEIRILVIRRLTLCN